MDWVWFFSRARYLQVLEKWYSFNADPRVTEGNEIWLSNSYLLALRIWLLILEMKDPAVVNGMGPSMRQHLKYGMQPVSIWKIESTHDITE